MSDSDSNSPINPSTPLPPTPPRSVQPEQAAPTTSGLAIASLVCGILGWLTCVTAIPAVIMGHIAKSNIAKSQGRQSGKGLAIAGLCFGYSSFAIFFLAVLASLATPAIFKALKAGELTKETHQVKMESVKLVDYHSKNGILPAQLSDLVKSGFTTQAVYDDLIQIKADPGVSMEWSYFPEADLMASPAEIILVSPAISNKVVVLYTDGTARQKQDADAKMLMSSQGGTVERILGTRP